MCKKEVPMEFLFFFDIDGVFNIQDDPNKTLYLEQTPVSPIPATLPLLRLLEKDITIKCVWLSHWAEQSNAWNRYAGIQHWDVAYPLPKEEQAKAEKIFPNRHDKSLALAYYLGTHAYNYFFLPQVYWIQDGFTEEEKKETQFVHHVNTLKEPLHTLLLQSVNGREVFDFLRSDV
jgi:hypothetical protein